MFRAIVFDFDGVIADSEVLSNSVLAEFVTELGVPTTLEDSYANFMGKRFCELLEAIELTIGRRLPDGFAENYQRRTLERFRLELRPIKGAREFIEALIDIPRCIASSSSPDRLTLCLEVLNMTDLFQGRVFSASNVARGKPHPDIFLYAAQELGVKAEECVVIEDSVGGVVAARAAGATVIGLTAAGHIQIGHDAKLMGAGARYVTRSFGEALEFVHPLFQRRAP
jgi:HAD superfamily hydrolase (TIGR01509 family)